MREKEHSLIVLQVLLLVLGAAAFYLAPHYSVIRSFGAIAGVVSVILIRKIQG